MKKYAITGFNDEYFRWGISWIASLQTLAKFEGQIFVVGFNLSKSNQSKIIDTGVSLINNSSESDFRNNTFLEIVKLTSNTSGVFAYWDSTVYFQDKIDEIFDLAKNEFIQTHRSGFLAGPDHLWSTLSDIGNTMSFLDIQNDYDQILSKCYSKITKTVDSIWNYTEVVKLKDLKGILTSKNATPVAINIDPSLEKFIQSHNILFWEKHKRIYDRFHDKKVTTKYKLIGTHSNNKVVNNNN